MKSCPIVILMPKSNAWNPKQNLGIDSSEQIRTSACKRAKYIFSRFRTHGSELRLSCRPRLRFKRMTTIMHAIFAVHCFSKLAVHKCICFCFLPTESKNTFRMISSGKSWNCDILDHGFLSVSIFPSLSNHWRILHYVPKFWSWRHG